MAGVRGYRGALSRISRRQQSKVIANGAKPCGASRAQRVGLLRRARNDDIVARVQFCLIAVLVWLAALCLAPATARADALEGSDLYDRPVLAIDPGAHTASINSQAADAEGRFAVTPGRTDTRRVGRATTRLYSLQARSTTRQIEGFFSLGIAPASARSDA
jgi:hypothetical protein